MWREIMPVVEFLPKLLQNYGFLVICSFGLAIEFLQFRFVSLIFIWWLPNLRLPFSGLLFFHRSNPQMLFYPHNFLCIYFLDLRKCACVCVCEREREYYLSGKLFPPLINTLHMLNTAGRCVVCKSAYHWCCRDSIQVILWSFPVDHIEIL